MHVVRSTLSIAIARTTANMLLYGATTLFSGWAHLLAGETRPLYRRLCLDARLLQGHLVEISSVLSSCLHGL